jgi:general secretion pathway protein D
MNVQTVNTNRGNRTRVQVGPFNTLQAADKAAVSVRALALEADVIRQ